MLSPSASQMSPFHQHLDYSAHASSPVMGSLQSPCWLGLLPPGFPFVLPFPDPGETERCCTALLGRGVAPLLEHRKASALDWPLHPGKGPLAESALRFRYYPGCEPWWVVGVVFWTGEQRKVQKLMQPTGVSGEEKRNFVWTSVLSIFFISKITLIFLKEII